MKDQRPEGIEQYDRPAGGWDALKAASKTLAHQQVVAHGTITLLKANQPEGFDLPRCAWDTPNKSYRYIALGGHRNVPHDAQATGEVRGRPGCLFRAT
jgi:hypothetical protein